MASINEVRVTWTNWSGGPGVSTFYGDDVATLRSALGDFIAGIDQLVPGQVAITVPSEGRVLNDLTGELVGYWTDGVPINESNVLTQAFGAPAGACINWLTNGVVAGRSVRGRTFIVPLASGAYDTDGTLTATTLGDLRTAAAALAASGTMSIWSRPRIGLPGSHHLVQSSRVNDRVSILTSRRA